ncbi:MAG: hypothetical protein WA823_18505 [Candidatus Acidiferrales bacterium]
MRHLHYTSKETFLRHSLNFRVSHYLDLPDGSVIVTGQMDPSYREAFEAEADTTDVTGVFCTSGSEREFTLEGSWYADEEIQAGADRNAAAAG